MSKDNEIPADDMIELAMVRHARETAAAEGAPAKSSLAGGRNYNEALSRRLDQIGTALGSEDPQRPALALSASESCQEAEPPQLSNSPEVRQVSGYRLGALVLSGSISALMGAGLMWLAMSAVDRGRVPETLAAVAPVAAQPLLRIESEAQARGLVERWRQAWVSRDIEAYLSCYSPDFVPAGSQTRGSWAAARRMKLATPSNIRVQVHHMSIEHIDHDRLKVEFQQDYESGRYLEVAQPKTLLLIRTGRDWLIAGEWQGTRSASSLAGK